MKKTKKLLLAVLSVLTAGFCTLGVAGCTDDSVSGNGDITDWTMESVYAKAQELGYTGTLEEFIDMVSGIDGVDGKDGKDGVGIEEIYINAEGRLLVKLTGQKTATDLGKVVGENGDSAIENEQGLDFYLLDNGTYGVKAGTASYLTEITIPSTYKGRAVTEVLDYFFGGKESGIIRTQSIIIPDSVTSIGDIAFKECNSLTSVTIGNGVTSIGDIAFSGCSSLTSITIGNGVTSIGDYEFSYCSSLTSITIPDGVTSIGDYAFSNCSVLTSITFNGTVAEWNAIEKGDYWNNNIPATKVVCEGGVVEI